MENLESLKDALKTRYEAVLQSSSDSQFYLNIHAYIDLIRKNPFLSKIMDDSENEYRRQHIAIWPDKSKTDEEADEREERTIRLERFNPKNSPMQSIGEFLGLKTSSGKKVLKGKIQKMIINPFYTGIMVREGKYYNGNHEPLISKITFDMAQQVAENRSRPKSNKYFFPLRGFLKCEVCGCALTASLKKGHHYYYCTNGKQKCEEHKSYLRENYLYDKMSLLFENLDFTERKIELMYQAAKERVSTDTEYLDTALASLQSSIDSLKTRESKLLDTFLAEQISKELYDSKILDFHNERISLQKQISELKVKHPISTLEPTKEFFLRGSRAKKEFLDKDDEGKKEILESLLWNLSFEGGNVAQIKYKSPYDIMAKADKNADFQTLCPSPVWYLHR